MESQKYSVITVGKETFFADVNKLLNEVKGFSFQNLHITGSQSFKKNIVSNSVDLLLIDLDYDKVSVGNLLSNTRVQQNYLPILLFAQEPEEKDISGLILNGATDVISKRNASQAPDIILRELLKYHRNRRLEESNRRSYDLANIGHWEINLKDDHIFWSDKVREIFEVGPEFEPNINNGLKFYQNNGDRKLVEDTLNSVIQKGGTFEFEHEIVTEKGNKKYIRVVGHCLRMNDETIKVFGTTQDITKEKNTERELTQAKKFYELAVEGAEVGLWEVDLESFDTFYNPTYYEMLGYIKEDVIFTKDFHNSIIHPFDHVTIEEHMKKIMSGSENSFEEIIRLRNKEGEYRWILDRAKVVSYKDGKAYKLAGSHIDVTDQVLAERESKNNLNRLKLLIDASPVAIFQTDEKGEIVESWNRAAEHVFGFTENEALGKTFDELVELSEEDLKLIREVRTGKALKYHIIHCNNRKGEKRVLEVSTGPIFDNDHKLNHTLVLTTDVTELYEKQQKLKESVEEKTILLKEIHHRVKNNLAIISGLLELQVMNGEVTPVIKKSINRIKAIALVHEKLYNSKNLSEINLKEYYDSLVESIIGTFNLGLKVTKKLQIDIDYLNINQAVPLGLLTNELITNTMKYAFDSDDAGEITIDLRQDETGKLYYKYSDNGKGFDFSEEYSSGSFGINLITTIISQLTENYTMQTEKGFSLEFQFDKIERGAHSNLSLY